MKRILIIASVLMLMASSISAQIESYEKHSYVVAGDTLNYRLLKPLKYKEGNSYPLVVFLHGSGERGNDNEKQLTWGAQMFLNPVVRDKFPAYVIFPQCPEGTYWASEERQGNFDIKDMPFSETPAKNIKFLRGLINEYIAKHNADDTKIYLIGLSMGAMGVYDFVSRYPELITAAVAICGSANIEHLENARISKWFIFHGDSDPIVPVECSREAYRKLKKEGITVDYTEFPCCDHNSWSKAFNTKDFLKDLFREYKSSK